MPRNLGEFCDEQFPGVVRLFPLPGLVMFPHVVQALHIFEPRYRQMLADALKDDKLIAMATLAEGWQGQYDGRPPIHTQVCLGQITSHSLLEDGCSNILMIGLRRAKIVGELDSDRLYRAAKVELIQDHYAKGCDEKRCKLQAELIAAFKSLMPESALVADQLAQNMSKEACLGALTDLVGYSLKLSTDAKQQLLGQPNVDVRARFLLKQIADWGGPADDKPASHRSGFPPDFSDN